MRRISDGEVPYFHSISFWRICKYSVQHIFIYDKTREGCMNFQCGLVRKQAWVQPPHVILWHVGTTTIITIKKNMSMLPVFK